jgi:hypothetical protein
VKSEDRRKTELKELRSHKPSENTMGKSAKAKKEAKQSFQKPKLKVGKTKAKSDNFTDTSFKSKCS